MISTHSEALYTPLIDIVYRLSVIGYRLSVIAYRFCGYRLSFIVTVVGLGMRATVNGL